jgi:hypothetical protein
MYSKLVSRTISILPNVSAIAQPVRSSTWYILPRATSSNTYSLSRRYPYVAVSLSFSKRSLTATGAPKQNISTTGSVEVELDVSWLPESLCGWAWQVKLSSVISRSTPSYISLVAQASLAPASSRIVSTIIAPVQKWTTYAIRTVARLCDCRAVSEHGGFESSAPDG